MIEIDSQQELKLHGGVKTPEGKAVSRYNAQKHSILRTTVSDYEQVDHEDIYNNLAEDLRPVGYLQESMIQVIASNLIRLQRIAKAESEVLEEALAPMIQTEASVYNSVIGEAFKAYTSPVTTELADRLILFSRYQTATENRLYRAMVMYKQLKYEQS